MSVLPPWPPAIASFYQFDLFGRFGFDNRAAALLDPSAHADAAAFKLFRLDARRGKGALMASQNGDGESLNPAPPEANI